MTNIPVDPLVIIELTNLKAAGKCEELAKHPALGLKPEWMGDLVKNDNFYVRSALASNKALSASPEAARALASSEHWLIRRTLAQTRPWPTIQRSSSSSPRTESPSSARLSH